MVTENLNKVKHFWGRMQKVYNMYAGIVNIVSREQILVQKSILDGVENFILQTFIGENNSWHVPACQH